MANSSDADGDPLTVTRASVSSGALQAKPGSVRFVADTDKLGTVQISYQVTDGVNAVAQTAFVTVVENQFEGSTGADLLLGTECRDRVTCHGFFPPSATRVRPKEGTDDEANDTKRRADHRDLAGA
ncbi:MAG: cadherin-like domain-containing protein [Rhodobacteraceae bacterium]|nr:cadherin-like domain-containing protein [Paracoccaceae bacterium]